MTTFDPTRVLNLVRTFESGTTPERLELVDGLDMSDPIATGVLMRALADTDAEVRLRALGRLDEAGVRPVDAALRELLDDDDERIRALAARVEARDDTLNPLEQLIPQIERAADALGPLGGLLRQMIQTLRDIGNEDERTQLISVARLDNSNPVAPVVIQQALQSPHIAVRIAALNKVPELEHARVSEALITQFITDPSADLRAAAETVIRAGKVGSFDDDALRSDLFQSMMQSVMGGLTGGSGGLGGLDLSSLLGGLGGLTGFTDPGHVADSDGPPSAETHWPAGHLYVVCDERARDRLRRSLTRLTGGDEPQAVRLEHALEPGRWAIQASPHGLDDAPGWVRRLAEAGLTLSHETTAGADQARHLSEQIWGAAWADHESETAVTLVFHDGTLSRAAWAGAAEGAWTAAAGRVDPSPNGPLGLLRAFLDDPTDDGIEPVANPGLLQLAG